ncbi:MAG: M3 family metallopeptidase [Dermatophilaceae bacterium]
MTNSGLTPLNMPDSPESWGDWLGERCGTQLATARALVAAIKDAPPTDTSRLLTDWNEVSIALGNAMSAASLISQVHPQEALRSQAETAEQEGNNLSTDLGLDRDLFEIFAAADSTGLDEGAARLLRLTLRDFRRAGVDQDEPTRARLRELGDRELVVDQEFGKNIRDDVRSISVTGGQLAGLPQDYIDAHPVGADGCVTITTDYPDLIPFMTFALDAEARRALVLEFNNRAWPVNDAVLQELLGLRAEHARILGFDSWADFDAEVKMIGRGAAIGEFIDQITEAADESGRRDLAVLLERLRADRPEVDVVDSADSAFYKEVVRRERFDVDAQQVRRYFEFAKVRQGLLDVTGRLFGLSYDRVQDAESWHEDVAVYDVQLEGIPLGRIYLDLHPREGKYKHAAQFDLAPGIRDRQLPEGVLVCNFGRGLMEHSDVVTLFHEFGHLVHHLLAGRHHWARFSGVATEWDFVEAPSQLLEEWAWDASVLRSFATDDAGEPIPEDLVAKMRAGEDFGKGCSARTQMFYAALSYRLHQEPVADITAFVKEVQAAYDLFAHVEGTHFHASFGHLSGYSSAYYTYMWSLVIAKDLFSAFDRKELFAPQTARRYRDTILAAGGSKDAADLVADFLGRPYTIEAFSTWLQEAPTGWSTLAG